MDEVWQYQTLVCAYMTSFLEVLIVFDKMGLKLKGNIVFMIKEHGRILLDNSRDPTIVTITGDHHNLLQVLKNQWQAFHGEDKDCVAPKLVKYYVQVLHYDALFTNGVCEAKPWSGVKP